MKYLPYDPGLLPSAPPPKPGDEIEVHLNGYPPYKDRSRSIRNVEHRIYERFAKLRKEVFRAMKGRACYRGPIGLDLTMWAPEFEKGRALNDYTGGVMDSLDGSHGASFTYLPVAYEDDCQVCAGRSRLHKSNSVKYSVRIEFIDALRY